MFNFLRSRELKQLRQHHIDVVHDLAHLVFYLEDKLKQDVHTTMTIREAYQRVDTIYRKLNYMDKKEKK